MRSRAADISRHARHRVHGASRLRAVALLIVTLAPGAAFAQNVVPADFQGAWVPNNAACDSALRMQVAANQLTLVNGKDSQTLAGVEMAGPGYFPPNYRGIEAVLFTEFSGHQPVIVKFNPDEKRGLAQAELATVIAKGAPTPQLKAYNAHIGKLDLAKRFPLDRQLMKKCR